jgi:hypothetical protein
MVDNIHWLPSTYGAALRAHYGDLPQQALSPQLEALMVRLRAAGDGSPPDMAAADAPQPPKPPLKPLSGSLSEPLP